MAETQATESNDAEQQGPPGAVAEPVEPAATEAPLPTQVVVRKSPKALSQRDPVKIAEHFFKSGYFKDTQSMSQAVVKIIAGEELGLGPMASVQGITIIEGKLGFTGNLTASLVKQHETYSYKVLKTTNERCVIEFYDGDELQGVSEFTVEDAERAELVKDKSNWVKWPKAMCFNRALTQGVRAYIPDVTAGTPAYTDDEIEEVVTEQSEGEVVEEGSAPTLDPERVEHLNKGIGIVGTLDDFNVILGSLGIDALDPLAVTDGLAKLTPEQADALDAEVRKIADALVEDAEIVEGDDDGE